MVRLNEKRIFSLICYSLTINNILNIIILLILAGISISALINNGIIGQTTKAQIISRKAKAEEILKLRLDEIIIDKLGYASLEEILEELKQEEETQIDVIEVKTDEIATISCNIPVGQVTEITVVVKKYDEFEFTIGQGGVITKICGIDYEDWDGETRDSNEASEDMQITIQATPESQTEEYVSGQEVEISVETTQKWTNYLSKYAWSIDNENEPEEWKTLTLEKETTYLRKGNVLGIQKIQGNYYLWVKVIISGKEETQCFGQYKLLGNPTEEDLVCEMTQVKDNGTKGIVTVGSNITFSGWKCLYQLNDGIYTEITTGTTTIEVVKNDIITVKFTKEGYTDIVKTLQATELKQAYVLSYDANDSNSGVTAPSSQIQYDNNEFTITSTKPTKTGWTFVKWNTKANGTGTDYNSGESITITENTTLYAQWIKATVISVTSEDYSTLTRKQDLDIRDFFTVEWGDEGVGTIEYSVSGNITYTVRGGAKTKAYSSTTLTNASELEIGTYTVTCKAINQLATATQTKSITVANLKETTVTNSSGSSVEAKAIYSEYDLAKFRDLVNAGQTTLNGKLMNPITMSNVSSYSSSYSWTPIGNSSRAYSGIFDGGKNTIDNLKIYYTASYEGLFGYISGATLKGVIIGSNSQIYGGNDTGAVCGYSNNSTITECGNNGTVTASNYKNIGGLVGTTNNTTVEYCFNKNTVDGNESVGGIIGSLNSSGTVRYCYNNGDVTGSLYNIRRNCRYKRIE